LLLLVRWTVVVVVDRCSPAGENDLTGLLKQHPRPNDFVGNWCVAAHGVIVSPGVVIDAGIGRDVRRTRHLTTASTAVPGQLQALVGGCWLIVAVGGLSTTACWLVVSVGAVRMYVFWVGLGAAGGGGFGCCGAGAFVGGGAIGGATVFSTAMGG
jgi:hypothetical protein